MVFVRCITIIINCTLCILVIRLSPPRQASSRVKYTSEFEMITRDRKRCLPSRKKNINKPTRILYFNSNNFLLFPCEVRKTVETVKKATFTTSTRYNT